MEDKKDKLTILRSVRIIVTMLKVIAKTRPSQLFVYSLGAILEISGSIISLFAAAKLAALLAAFINSGQTAGIWLWLWIEIASAVVIGLGFLAMKYAKGVLYFTLVQWSMTRYFSTLSNIDLGSFYEEDVRNQINKVGGGYTWQLAQLSDNSLDLLYSIARFLAMTLVVSQITWWLVPVIAVFLIPTLIGEKILAQTQWFIWDEKGDERHIFWGLEWIIKQVKGQMELRSLQSSKYIQDKLSKMNQDFYKVQEKKYKDSSKILILTKALEAAGTAIGEIVVLKQLLKRSISLDKYFFLSGALLRIGGALNSIFGLVSAMQTQLLFAESYFEITSLKPTITDKPNAVELKSKGSPEIIFENVSFHYPNKKKMVFENLNLTIKPGEHIALVGENGAGKSTLIKLLMRFYKPTSGRILIDGLDINDIAIGSWYKHISTLFQDFNMYPLPIDENISIGRSDQPLDKSLLDNAAKFGNVDELIASYEHGWETVLDSSFKKGVEPSGGQWQRVALARSFYRNANVLILDEPTSAIDAKAEYDIFNNIFEHYKDRTALIVSHRFSTVRRADRIVVLQNGSIVEQGSHQNLMKQKGIYEKLFSNQAKGYQK